MAKEKAVSVKGPPAFGYLSPFTLDQPSLMRAMLSTSVSGEYWLLGEWGSLFGYRRVLDSQSVVSKCTAET
jgi:hypothetical protein